MYGSLRIGAVVAALLLVSQAAAPQDGLEQHLIAAEEAWAQRGVDGSDERARDSIQHLEAVLEIDPGHLDARWKLARSLYFLGEYAIDDTDERLALFTRGKELTEETLDQIAATIGERKRLDKMTTDELAATFRDQPAVARVYFWGAVHWGLWGRAIGTLSAARQGVAGRIRNYAATVIALDPSYEFGGGHRILGRLHAEAPKVPFFTGWIDRNVAVSELKLAVQAAPEDFFNRLYLAEALIEFRPEQRKQGLENLRQLAADAPAGENQIEEAYVLELAQTALRKYDDE